MLVGVDIRRSLERVAVQDRYGHRVSVSWAGSEVLVRRVGGERSCYYAGSGFRRAMNLSRCCI